VVLPFENLSADPADKYLVDGITDDLTTDLAAITSLIIAKSTAHTYQGKVLDVKQIGQQLGVRYVVEGSVRRIGTMLRVNAALIASETGAELWSDRFDEQIADLAAGQEQIVARMRSGIRINLVDIEAARSLRERPANPDAVDLVLRANSVNNQIPTPQREAEAKSLYERALLLDPSSVSAMIGVSYFMIDHALGSTWSSLDDMERTERLLKQARAIAPTAINVLWITANWLRSMGRCQEMIELAQQALRMDSYWTREALYYGLGKCKTMTGHAEEEISLQEKAIRVNPRSRQVYVRYLRMGFASLMLGQDQDAITYSQRSLAMNDPDNVVQTSQAYRQLAAAYARTGQIEEARRSLAEADRLWPYDTVRGHSPDDQTSAVYAEQIRQYQAALRLAGERDHADEDADFGVPTDRALHSNFLGLTPTTAPGAKTIHTADLVRLLAQARPVVVDTVKYSWGRSIPGAVGLRNAGLGGNFTDVAQDRLRHKILDLSGGDLNRPIVAVGWNSERFDGRNLALRLVAMGYSQVYWYRGGREAWEANGLPEADITLTEWQ
jgi:TolB-like protein/rhodanese-related sulfurtransferase